MQYITIFTLFTESQRLALPPVDLINMWLTFLQFYHNVRPYNNILANLILVDGYLVSDSLQP